MTFKAALLMATLSLSLSLPAQAETFLAKTEPKQACTPKQVANVTPYSPCPKEAVKALPSLGSGHAYSSDEYHVSFAAKGSIKNGVQTLHMATSKTNVTEFKFYQLNNGQCVLWTVPAAPNKEVFSFIVYPKRLGERKLFDKTALGGEIGGTINWSKQETEDIRLEIKYPDGFPSGQDSLVTKTGNTIQFMPPVIE